ncbi:MAG: phosphopantetheine-binding protein [Clostridia bacterium]|nr:phosphopantetheine-binding protein [Clostridia bacterium]
MSDIVIEKITKIFELVIGVKLDPDKITAETTLSQDMGLSSINMLYLAIAIEEEFKIELTNLNVNSFKTVGDVYNYLNDVYRKEKA